MEEKVVTVNLKSGLQARQAAMFVQEANRFSSDIFVQKEHTKVNAKSIMGIMSLAIARGSEVTLLAEGTDAEEAVNALASIVENEG
jgi:catabolite repression HPr-like protein